MPPNVLIQPDNSDNDMSNSFNSNLSNDGKMYTAVLNECQDQSRFTIRQDDVVDVNDKVSTAFRALVDRCKSAGKSIQVLIFQYKILLNFKETGSLNTLCSHNAYGLIDEAQCPGKYSCYHKTFTFPTKVLVSTTSALKCTFYRNPEVTNIQDASG